MGERFLETSLELNKNNLYQIGEVSKLCNISVKTLRYYDEIDLLKPRIVDKFSNYRYYSQDQLVYILIIKHLKEADFSLKEIKVLLGRENMEYNKLKFDEKCKEIDDKINDLLRVKQKLKFCIMDSTSENESKKNCECQIKYIPEMYIAYLRDKWHTTPEEFTIMYCKLMTFIEKNKFHTTKNVMALYHDPCSSYEIKDSLCDIEVCAQVSETSEIPGKVRKFGGFRAVSKMHYGKYNNMAEEYKSMLEFIMKNGYEICGPAIDNYIVDIVSTCDPNNYVTELLIPIK